MNEITNNLNAYWNNNKSYFSDRATFNSTFHYNDRQDLKPDSHRIGQYSTGLIGWYGVLQLRSSWE